MRGYSYNPDGMVCIGKRNITVQGQEMVSADLVNITLSGGGDVAIDGSSKACEDNMQWSGGGDLTAGVKVGGDLTLKVPYVIVLKKEIKGSTSITEKLSTDPTNLKITTNWGGWLDWLVLI